MDNHKVDTLILSGGGPSGIAYVGIFKALTDYEIIDKSEIKELITTSVGIIFSILYLLDYNILQIYKFSLQVHTNLPKHHEEHPCKENC